MKTTAQNFGIWYSADTHVPLMNPARLFGSRLCRVNDTDTYAVYCFYRRAWYTYPDDIEIHARSFCMISQQ